jgi:hypothetical protein
MNSKFFSCDNCAVVLDANKILGKNTEKMYPYMPMTPPQPGEEHIQIHMCPVCGYKISLNLNEWPSRTRYQPK